MIILYFHDTFEKDKDKISKLIRQLNAELSPHLSFDVEFASTFYPSLSKLKNAAQDYVPDLFIWKKKNYKKYNGVLIVPPVDVNLHRNYLWYSIGIESNFVMVVSSYLYSTLISGKIAFMHYIFILLSQFFARRFVKIEAPHSVSQNCLNDFCIDQSDLLNVRKNERYICDSCIATLTDDELYKNTKKLLGFLEKHKVDILLKKASKTVKRADVFQKIPHKGKHFQIEIYMSKKTSNLSGLYNNLDGLLNNIDSKLDGFSLYFVEGGWRQELGHLVPKKMYDLNKVIDIVEKYKKGGILQYPFKDLIRPIKRPKNNNIYAVYEEGTIVLRFLITIKNEKVHEELDTILEEIKQMFVNMGENENSIMYTAQEIKEKGSFEKVFQQRQINNGAQDKNSMG